MPRSSSRQADKDRAGPRLQRGPAHQWKGVDVTTLKSEREDGLELALQLMGVSAEGLAKTTNTLIDNLTAERDELRAEIAAMRHGIELMLDGNWMPTSDALRRALWPSADMIDRFRKAHAS